MQSRAFEKFINIVPLITLFSKHFCHFPVITKRRVLSDRRDPSCIFNELRKMLTWRFLYFFYLSFKNWNHIYIFDSEMNATSHIELLKLWKINSKERISMSSLIIFTGISLSWQAFLLSRLWICAKIFFSFQNKRKVKIFTTHEMCNIGWYLHFLIALKAELLMSELVILLVIFLSISKIRGVTSEWRRSLGISSPSHNNFVVAMRSGIFK